MKNHLAGETSPYLLQHVSNPVEWYPWGTEALERARREDRPILLSVGYSACHWCHVMSRESFEDPATAEIMNAHFVNIKVDREERPDIDSVYMKSVTAFTGSGGWPMTVFLTPDGRPFYAGTYFPPRPGFGLPAFPDLLRALAAAWKNEREAVEEQARRLTGMTRDLSAGPASRPRPIEDGLFTRALNQLRGQFDRAEGGFGGAPKFPPSTTLEYLLRYHLAGGNAFAREAAGTTLKKMAAGGIRDQVGGGFARYSTDGRWLVPHFEKMLYDNALLARVYLHAWKITGERLYRRVAVETLDFLVRELRHPAGGFFSSLDADSEGAEGRYYLWTKKEIGLVLGDEAELFGECFALAGLEGRKEPGVLYLARPVEETARRTGLSPEALESRIDRWRAALAAARALRPRPPRDEKILASWNGLALAAFAEAGRWLERPDYAARAEECAVFARKNLWVDGRLRRVWTEKGGARLPGCLEDYAFLADGLLALYRSGFDENWFSWIRELAGEMLDRFREGDKGPFFDTPEDHGDLILRPREVQDGPTPSGNAAAALLLAGLGRLTGEERWLAAARSALEPVAGMMEAYPTAFGASLSAALFLASEPVEVAVIGRRGSPDTEKLLAVLFARWRPHTVFACGEENSNLPLLQGRKMVEGRAAAYVCRRFSCRRPVVDAAGLEELID